MIACGRSIHDRFLPQRNGNLHTTPLSFFAMRRAAHGFPGRDGRLRSHSRSHVFLACWGRSIASCVCVFVDRSCSCHWAPSVLLHRGTHAWLEEHGGRALALALALTLGFCARLARWGEATVGSRQSASCCHLWLRNRRSLALVSSLNFCCAFGGCRVLGFADTRERPHA